MLRENEAFLGARIRTLQKPQYLRRKQRQKPGRGDRMNSKEERRKISAGETKGGQICSMQRRQ